MTGPHQPLLLGSELTKRYGGVSALSNVSLGVEPGASVALLGPNGAGKTTLLRVLAGVIRPSEGSVVSEREGTRVGWVPHTPAVYRRLTTRENVRLFCELEGAADPTARAARLLERADLERFADRPAAELSTGTLQRLNLCVALAGEPTVLLLDEPTATLSADQVRRLWRWLDELRHEDELALVFSTQSVDEAARFGQRMVVLDAGKVVFTGSVEELLAAHGDPTDAPSDAAEAAFLRLVGATV